MSDKERLKLAEEALSIIAEIFTYKSTGLQFDVPDDDGWFYVSKKRADKFKQAYAKFLFR